MTVAKAGSDSSRGERSSHEIKRTGSESSEHLENIGVASPVTIADDGIYENESPQNPRNWPHWKKNAQILMVAFHSMMGTFMAAGIVPAYDAFAEEYNVTVPAASYLTSFQILLLGLSPLIWNPVTAVYGQYHVTLLSVFGSMLCNIGGARCTSYGAQMATRVLTAILISPPIGNGSGVITELCEPEHRGKKIGWWTLMTTIGTPSGPFFMGFVIKHIGVQWIFWIFAIINFCQFLMYLAIGDETIYNPKNERKTSGFWSKLVPRKISSRSLRPLDIVAPFSLASHPRILIAAFAHAITFCYANIAIIVEMPIAFGEKFHFDAQQIGLQFIAIIIGCVLGEQISGPMCDWFMERIRKTRGHSCPADRLWLSYIAFATIFAGLLTWGFQLQHATTWNVTPCVGAAIASFGNQMQTTILTTFAVESNKERASQVGVFVNVCRQIYGFLGPFYFPDMFSALGFGGAAGVMVAIIGGCALLPMIAVQFVSTRSDTR
ncbi:Sucrose/H+ symporter [Penicillium brevicompactum]